MLVLTAEENATPLYVATLIVEYVDEDSDEVDGVVVVGCGVVEDSIEKFDILSVAFVNDVVVII